MNKTIITSLLCLSLVFSACTPKGQYDVDLDLPADQIEIHETQIDESQAAIDDSEATPEDKLMATKQIAVSHERLGNYDKAIEIYQQVLEQEPADFLALNNLAAIYEEVDELDLATSYIVQLHTNYNTQKSVIKDTIRILAKNGAFDNAQLVLEEYARNSQSIENAPFISDQFDFIRRMRQVATDGQE